jgi:hypothetical protein
MEKKLKIKLMLNGPYVVINQINKIHRKGCPLRQFFDIHVKGEKILIRQKMTKIGAFENKV